jgi:hypothetical protein
MDFPDEVNYDISQYTADIDPMIVEMIKLSERVKIFSKLRNLIHQKQYEHDEVAANILGSAYEKLGD